MVLLSSTLIDFQRLNNHDPFIEANWTQNLILLLFISHTLNLLLIKSKWNYIYEFEIDNPHFS